MAEQRERSGLLPSMAVVFVLFLAMAARWYWSQQPETWRAEMANHAWQAGAVSLVLLAGAAAIALALGALWLVVRVIRSAWKS